VKKRGKLKSVRQSPIAVILGFGRNLALPLFLVPCPLSHVPFQVGAQFLRHKLLLLSTEFIRRLKIREGEPPGEPKSGAGAKCGVQLLKAEKFFGSAEALTSKTTYYSLLTIRCRSTSRQSLFAIRFRFGSAGALPSRCFLA